MMSSNRRYDIDWVRVISIGLLLIYHVSIGFQPWGIMIQFIANDEPWEGLWIPMTMLNVWRIPLLFFVSGMGVYFALRRRSWQQLVRERITRIGVPFVFGIFTIVPVHVYLWQHYYQFEERYTPNPGHLWFLGNILVYVVVLLPVMYYLKSNENGAIVKYMRRLLSTPLGILPVSGAFVAEVLILDPKPYELYAMTEHGFFLGLLSFLFGFCFVLSGKAFWEMVLKWRFLFLIGGAVLFTIRLLYFQPYTPGYLLAIESNCWVLSVLAFGYRYLNQPSKLLTYLSEAAYPVYLLHMIFLYLGSWMLFPLQMAVEVKFSMLLTFTVLGSFMAYDLVVKRVGFLRFLFGLRKERIL